MERQFNSVFQNITSYLNITPYLYRYENQCFIDDFFHNGNILLSSFADYRKYKDNELGDVSEGETFNHGYTQNNKSIISLTKFGLTSYCMCTSTLLEETLKEKFNRDSVFRIKDPINFILQINKSLTRVTEVYYGNCIYLHDKIFNIKIPDFELGENGAKSVNDDPLNLVAQLKRPDRFFLKDIKYQAQSEYRIVWITDREVNSPIIINCPEAIPFCEKIA